MRVGRPALQTVRRRARLTSFSCLIARASKRRCFTGGKALAKVENYRAALRLNRGTFAPNDECAALAAASLACSYARASRLFDLLGFRALHRFEPLASGLALRLSRSFLRHVLLAAQADRAAL